MTAANDASRALFVAQQVDRCREALGLPTGQQRAWESMTADQREQIVALAGLRNCLPSARWSRMTAAQRAAVWAVVQQFAALCDRAAATADQQRQDESAAHARAVAA